jgi:hypothetical protein
MSDIQIDPSLPVEQRDKKQPETSGKIESVEKTTKTLYLRTKRKSCIVSIRTRSERTEIEKKVQQLVLILGGFPVFSQSGLPLPQERIGSRQKFADDYQLVTLSQEEIEEY